MKKVLKIAQCLSLAQVYLEVFLMEMCHTLGDGKQSCVSLDPESGDWLASLAQVPLRFSNHALLQLLAL